MRQGEVKGELREIGGLGLGFGLRFWVRLSSSFFLFLAILLLFLLPIIY